MVGRASAVDASLSWERRSYIVCSLTWGWPLARCIGVARSSLHGEGAGVGGVGNGGGVWWPGGDFAACGWALDGGGDSL